MESWVGGLLFIGERDSREDELFSDEHMKKRVLLNDRDSPWLRDVLMAMICSNNCSISSRVSGMVVVVVFDGENSTSSLHLHLPTTTSFSAPQ